MRNSLFLTALALVATSTFAAEPPAGSEKLSQRLQQMMPGIAAEISESPTAGYSEVAIGPQLIYMSNDGRYLLKGELVDLDGDINITEKRRSAAVLKAVDQVGENNMVVFGNGDAKHTITVFTDIDCGYCRKLHNEMADYNKAGIRVRYLFYPRSGINTESFDKAVSVWCSKDRQQAMTLAKNGKPIDEVKCDNPVAAHMELGQMMGPNGTPALVLPDGELLPGYVPAKRLKEFLDSRAAN